MTLMKAVVCKKYGPPEVLQLEECNKPHMKNNEILIKIFATSVTNSDIFIRSSKVSFPLLLPFRLMIGITKPRNPIIGQVFSGIIEQIGARITKFRPGDKVYGLTGFSLGAYAEYKSIKEINSKQGCVALMPENVTFEEATAVAYGGLLALQFLDKKELKKYNKVLIYGAASTSGIIAVQYLKYMGLNITAVCRENKFDFVKSLGANKTLDYTRAESINDLENYDLIFDCVGKAKKSELKKLLSKHISDKRNMISIDDEALLLSSKRLEKIRELVEKKILQPINDRVYNIDQIIEAHKYVEIGHKKGNVAITIAT